MHIDISHHTYRFFVWKFGAYEWPMNVSCRCQKYSSFHLFLQIPITFQSLKFEPSQDSGANIMILLKYFESQFLHFFNCVNPCSCQPQWWNIHNIYKRCYFFFSQLPKIKNRKLCQHFWQHQQMGSQRAIRTFVIVKRISWIKKCLLAWHPRPCAEWAAQPPRGANSCPVFLECLTSEDAKMEDKKTQTELAGQEDMGDQFERSYKSLVGSQNQHFKRFCLK